MTDIFEALRRGWRFPLYGLLIGIVLATVAFIYIPTPYKSSARVLVDRSINRYLQTNKIADQPMFDEGEISSQVYVLSSDSVVMPVVKALGLAHDKELAGLPRMGGARIPDYLGDLKRLIFGANAQDTNDAEAALERAAADAVVKGLTVTREDVANVINVAFEFERQVQGSQNRQRDCRYLYRDVDRRQAAVDPGSQPVAAGAAGRAEAASRRRRSGARGIQGREQSQDRSRRTER